LAQALLGGGKGLTWEREFTSSFDMKMVDLHLILFGMRNSRHYSIGCASKNGKIFVVVALKSVTPPSSPKVLGHEWPRWSTV
jgi:hypothetical protein